MKAGETAIASAAIRLTVRPTSGSNFSVTKIDPMLASTTGSRSAQMWRPKSDLREEENVEMKRPVIIRRVVAVEAVLHHLIDEPAVDPLVEVRRLHAQEEKPEERAEGDDRPERPIDPGEPLRERRRGGGGVNFSSRGLALRC